MVARQLELRARFKAAGLVDHDHLFFTAEGRMIRHLQYAAWTEGAPESEVAVIREAMGLNDRPLLKKAPPVGTRIGTSGRMPQPKSLKSRDLIGGKGGTRTLDLGIMSATL